MRQRRQGGYKLLELVVAMGVLSTLFAFLLPTLYRLQESAQRQQVRARSHGAMERLLATLRSDLQGARRVVLQKDCLWVEPSFGGPPIRYRHQVLGRTPRPIQGFLRQEGGKEQWFDLPPDCSLRFEGFPSRDEVRTVVVRAEGGAVKAMMRVTLRPRAEV